MSLLTTDLYEGAYFLTKHIRLEKLWTNGKNGKRSVVFQFEGSNVELLRNRYQKGKAEVNVAKFKQSLNDLKDLMFNLIRTPELQGAAGPTEEKERRNNHEKSTITLRQFPAV